MLVVDIKRLVYAAASSSSQRANLAGFFPPETAERIATAGRQIGIRRHEAAVLFIDIRGFTGIAETMPLEEVASLLSEYRARVVDAVVEWGGTVDKFMGDGIMAVFGFPEPRPNDATRCFECACELMHRLDTWNAVRARDGKAPLRFGTGLHFGHVIGGVIPGGQHSEYTVLGDAVNVAARLEETCKALDARIVASDAVIAHLPYGQVRESWGMRSEFAVPGRSGTMKLWFLPNDSRSAG